MTKAIGSGARVVAAVALACAALFAQVRVGDPAREDGRGTVLGWVEAPDGARVPGARVVLVSWPLGRRVDVGEVDLLRVDADDDGRFRARCLHGRSYSVWATWAGAQADAGTWVTDVTEDVVPGPPIALRAASLQPPKVVTIAGLDAWRARGDVAVTGFTSTKNGLGTPLPLDDDDRVTLPPLPGGRGELEVRAGRGGPLLRFAYVTADGAPTATVEVSPPIGRVVRVRDTDDAPLAGARVAVAPFYSPGGRHPRMVPSVVAVTGADGEAAVALPADDAFGRGKPPLLLVSADGCSTRFWQLGKGERTDVVLWKGFELRGRVLDGRGRPVAGLALLARHGHGFGPDGGGRFPCPAPAIVTDAEGRFVVDGRSDGADLQLRVLFAPGEARRLGVRVVGRVPFAPVQCLLQAEPAATDVDVGDLRLDALDVRQVTVLRHDGSPASNATLRLVHVSSNEQQEWITDRAGRLQVCAPADGVRWLAYRAGDGLAHTDEVIGGKLELRLSEPLVLTGRVLDREGKPVPAATVRSSYGHEPRFGDPLWGLTYQLSEASAPTGEDGRYRIVLPFRDAKFELRAWAVEDERWWSGPATAPPETGATLDLTWQRD